jgi:ATP-dependent phosphofructokinase / diphosphate-dependent phosphofructokinase
MESVAIADAVSRLRRVDTASAAVQAARALGISFGDCPKSYSPFHAPAEASEQAPIEELQYTSVT